MLSDMKNAKIIMYKFAITPTVEKRATATQASNVFNQNGYYKFQARLVGATQQFTSSEFGHKIKVPLT